MNDTIFLVIGSLMLVCGFTLEIVMMVLLKQANRTNEKGVK